MKSLIFFGCIYFVLMPLIALGCDTSNSTTLPPTSNVTVEDKTIGITLDEFGTQRNIVMDVDVTLDQFMIQKNIVKNIELTHPDSLIVSLGSNPSTGYAWSENAAMLSAEKIIVQQSHSYISSQNASDEPVVGAAGTDVWTFKTLNTGTTTIAFSYGRPWEGGEKDTYTLTINVTVK